MPVGRANVTNLPFPPNSPGPWALAAILGRRWRWRWRAGRGEGNLWEGKALGSCPEAPPCPPGTALELQPLGTHPAAWEELGEVEFPEGDLGWPRGGGGTPRTQGRAGQGPPAHGKRAQPRGARSPLVPLTLGLRPGRCRAGALGQCLVASHGRGCQSAAAHRYPKGEGRLQKPMALRRGGQMNEIIAGPRTRRMLLPSRQGPVIPFLQQEPQI